MKILIPKHFFIVIVIGLLSVFMLGCNGSSGGGNDDGDDDGDQSLTITGESGDPVNLNGTWDSGCDESDDEDLAATRVVTTISGSTFSQNETQWYDSITCSGACDIKVVISGTFVLGDEVTADLDGLDVTNYASRTTGD